MDYFTSIIQYWLICLMLIGNFYVFNHFTCFTSTKEPWLVWCSANSAVDGNGLRFLRRNHGIEFGEKIQIV